MVDRQARSYGLIALGLLLAVVAGTSLAHATNAGSDRTLLVAFGSMAAAASFATLVIGSVALGVLVATADPDD